MKHQLKELLERKVSDLGVAKRATHCDPELSLSNAINTLKSANIGSLVVVEGGRVVGIFTERDVLMKCALQEISLGSAKVADYMTKNPVCIQRFETIGAVLQKMKDGKFRHIVIVDAYGNLEKVISLREIMDYLLNIVLTPDPIDV